MVNPEKLATLGTYDTVHRQTKHKETAQKTEKISNTDPTIKKPGDKLMLARDKWICVL